MTEQTNTEQYETVELELTDEEALKYMKMAHEMDITFNQFVELALKEAIERHKLKEQHDQSSSKTDC
jgi:hypothetical protein